MKSASCENMATPIEVKHYLAYWFQLGKTVVTDDGSFKYHPKAVIEGNRFSPEFENFWTTILMDKEGTYHLEGTNETISDLLSPSWDVVNCARCDMPVPMPEREANTNPCPCNDLPGWPNTELPQPRLPVDSNQHLSNLHQRISGKLLAE